MIQLNEFLASLLVDATKGHAAADRISGEIANIYKDNDLLKHFPVPKLSISTIDFEIKLAIAEYREIPVISEETNKQFHASTINYIKTVLPSLSEMKGVIKKIGLAEKLLQQANFINMIKNNCLVLIEQIPSAQLQSVDLLTSYSSYFASKLVENIMDFIERQRPKARKIATRNIDEGKIELTTKIQEIWSDYVRSWWVNFAQQNPQVPKERIPMISVEPKELLSLPPEKIAKATIHLELRPYEWTSMEVEDERKQKTVKYKLVPE